MVNQHNRTEEQLSARQAGKVFDLGNELDLAMNNV